MDKKTFAQLVENVRTDGSLTGAVTVYQPNGEGPIEIISGHHRVAAAIEAGVSEIDTVVITTPLPNSRKVALQLSHNALVGKDEPSTLAELYLGLELEAKRFSGLDDDMVASFQALDLSGISVGSIRYRDLTVHFLPEDEAEFTALLARCQKAKRASHHVSSMATFDRIFDTLVRIKGDLQIHNSAIALITMAELAAERLDQIADGQGTSAKPDPTQGSGR